MASRKNYNNTDIMIAITELKKDVKTLQDDVTEIKPFVKDYEKMKNRGVGIWIAVTLFFTALGGVLTNRLEKWFS